MKRFRLSPEKKSILWKTFLRNKKPSKKERTNLALMLNTPIPFINNWFRNNRAIYKQKYEYNEENVCTYFLVNCNALCIKPTKEETRKYLVNRENLCINAYFYKELGVYYLCYW